MLKISVGIYMLMFICIQYAVAFSLKFDSRIVYQQVVSFCV